MNDRDLNSLYKEKLRSLEPYFYKQAQGDEDKLQDLYLGLFLGLKEDPYSTNTYLKNRARWNMLKSLTKRQPHACFPPQQYDHTIDKIILNDFLSSLSPNSRKYAQCRLAGIPNSQLQSRFNYSKADVRKMKSEILNQFEEVYFG